MRTVCLLLSICPFLPQDAALSAPASAPSALAEAAFQASSLPPRMVWYTDMSQAMAEAKRLGRPMLLQSAAPRCHDVPGLWWPGYRKAEGSFLSNQELIQASHDWICVRPATYEDANEMGILNDYYLGFDGKVVNTVFCLLDPAGKPLTRTGRSPSSVFDSPADMLASMQRFAKQYSGKRSAPAAPEIASLRLALNVAACDGLGLVVGVLGAKASPAATQKGLAQLAWSKSLQGQAHYVLVREGSEEFKHLQSFAGFSKAHEIYLLQPGPFGQEAQVLAGAKLRERGLKERFAQLLKEHRAAPKNPRKHIVEGQAKALEWTPGGGEG